MYIYIYESKEEDIYLREVSVLNSCVGTLKHRSVGKQCIKMIK